LSLENKNRLYMKECASLSSFASFLVLSGTFSDTMDQEFEGVPSTKRHGTYPHELQVRSHSWDRQLYVPSDTELDSETARQHSTKTPSQKDNMIARFFSIMQWRVYAAGFGFPDCNG
jgi:hypothetical protein